MKTTEKLKFFYNAGFELLSKLKSGEPLNPMTMKESFRDVGGKYVINTQEIMALTQYTKGLSMDTPNSNMSYYEALGYAVSQVDFNGVDTHMRLTKILQSKANADSFMSHPTSDSGMRLAEAFLFSAFNIGFIGKQDFSFG